MPSTDDRLLWYAPTWSTAPKAWWVLRKHILGKGPLLRIVLATTVATAAILGGFKWAYPEIDFTILWPVIFALPGLLLMLTVQIGMLSLIKASVLVTSEKIVVAHGQSASHIKTEWLTEVVLTVHDGDRSRVRFCYLRNGKRKFENVGIADNQDLFLLAKLLPIEITTRDARRHSKIALPKFAVPRQSLVG